MTRSARWVSRPTEVVGQLHVADELRRRLGERELIGGRPAAGGLTLHRHLEEAHVVTRPARWSATRSMTSSKPPRTPQDGLTTADPRRCGHPASAAAAGRSADERVVLWAEEGPRRLLAEAVVGRDVELIELRPRVEEADLDLAEPGVRGQEAHVVGVHRSEVGRIAVEGGGADDEVGRVGGLEDQHAAGSEGGSGVGEERRVVADRDVLEDVEGGDREQRSLWHVARWAMPVAHTTSRPRSMQRSTISWLVSTPIAAMPCVRSSCSHSAAPTPDVEHRTADLVEGPDVVQVRLEELLDPGLAPAVPVLEVGVAAVVGDDVAIPAAAATHRQSTRQGT